MTRQGSSVYAVEGAVWACFTGAWIAIRLSFSRSPLEEATLIPAAGLAVAGLLATSMSGAPRHVELAHFQVTFALWATLVYATAETLLTPAFAKGLLENQTFAVASLAISLAFLTVQTLVAAAGNSGPVWSETTWAAALVTSLTTLHAATKHDTVKNLPLSIVILWANFAAVCLQPAQLYGLSLELGIGPLSAQQILDICSISVQVVSAAFATGLAASEGRSKYYLILVALALPIAAQLYHLLAVDNYRGSDPVPTAEEVPQAEAQPPPYARPSEPQQSTSRVVRFPQFTAPQPPAAPGPFRPEQAPQQGRPGGSHAVQVPHFEQQGGSHAVQVPRFDQQARPSGSHAAQVPHFTSRPPPENPGHSHMEWVPHFTQAPSAPARQQQQQQSAHSSLMKVPLFRLPPKPAAQHQHVHTTRMVVPSMFVSPFAAGVRPAPFPSRPPPFNPAVVSRFQQDALLFGQSNAPASQSKKQD